MHLSRASLRRNLKSIGGSALFGYLSLFVLQAKVLWGAWQNWDLPMWDGATYYIYARQVAHSLIFPPVTWSPAFAAYYALFHAILGNAGPFAVYFSHRFVTLFLVLALLYELLRAALPSAVAWILAACSILLTAGLANNYVVHLFVLVPLLVAYRAALSKSSYRNSVILLGLLVASLVRTEFVLALALVAVMLIAIDWRQVRTGRPVAWRKAYGPVLLGGLLCVILVLRAGPSHTPVDRSWGAFEQHYAWGYQERHPEWNVDFWFRYAEAVQRSFGNAQSIGEAFANNPTEMLTHVLWNAHWFPNVAGSVFAPLPGADWILLVFLCGGVGLLVGLISPRPNWRSLIKSRFHVAQSGRYVLLVIVIACTWVPLAISTLIIRPRTIYLLPILPAVLLLIGAGLSILLSRLNWVQPAQTLLPIVFGVCLIAFPTPFNQPVDRTVMATVETLKDLPVTGDYALLGPSARGYCIYASPTHCTGVEIVYVPSSVDSFEDYVLHAGIRVIIVNNQLVDNLPLSGQAFVANLQLAPDGMGWQDAGVIGPFHLYWQTATALPR